MGRGWPAVLIVCVACLPISVDAQINKLRKQKNEATVRGDDTSMAAIPAGEFSMGLDGVAALEDERPRHKVHLDAYSMDMYEVTVARYARFLAATHRDPPAYWETVKLVEHGDRPVIGVDWEDAQAYCHWAGKRLPTEAEWEKAARGTDERPYPWGVQKPASDLANHGLGARFSYEQVLQPVGTYEKGKSPYGLFDMGGNVWEWTQDWYEGNYYEKSPKKNPSGPELGQFKVLRGGSWSDMAKYMLTYGRFKLPPGTRNSYTGFRCARPVTGDP